ncbi:MAG: DUF1554 domain-containing protein [Candidatus Andersenbacteria bacterium]
MLTNSGNAFIWVIIAVVIVGGAYLVMRNGTAPTSETLNPTAPATVVNVDQAQETSDTAMTFFVTSTNPGTGANFGGLAGADRHCQELAEAAGAGERTWRAYLSTTASAGQVAINARDRIGTGPWHNAAGVLIANTVAQLHDNNNINKQTALSETGQTIKGRGDTPNEHDILTGSSSDGIAATGTDDTTCSNWTSESEGSAIVGHHDRQGLDTNPPALSWNSSHASRGCSLDNLRTTGGAGLLYCFAAE